jgi:hypothetical protein
VVPSGELRRKYTLDLSDSDHERAVDVVGAVVKLSGIRTRKTGYRGDVIRAFFALAEHREDLRADLAELVAEMNPPQWPS